MLPRRALLAGAAALGALPGRLTAAPREPSVAGWSGYEARLRARLGVAAGGRFDPSAAERLADLTNAARVEAGAASCELASIRPPSGNRAG